MTGLMEEFLFAIDTFKALVSAITFMSQKTDIRPRKIRNSRVEFDPIWARGGPLAYVLDAAANNLNSMQPERKSLQRYGTSSDQFFRRRWSVRQLRLAGRAARNLRRAAPRVLRDAT